jgi:hypothetical protein
MTNWHTVTSTIDSCDQGSVGNGRATQQKIQMTPNEMSQPAMNPEQNDPRRGVRRTVTICVVVVVAFFLVSFVQILLMK